MKSSVSARIWNLPKKMKVNISTSPPSKNICHRSAPCTFCYERDASAIDVSSLMGIPGLTGYINSIGTLWTSIDLQNTNLVIDGSCLSHYLYVNNGFDCRCGGQYDEFYRVVLSFFDALISNGVESYVIFDGAHDPSDKKLKTLKARALERIKTSKALSNSADDRLFLRPLLSKLVFLQALRKRGVKFAVCDR